MILAVVDCVTSHIQGKNYCENKERLSKDPLIAAAGSLHETTVEAATHKRAYRSFSAVGYVFVIVPTECGDTSVIRLRQLPCYSASNLMYMTTSNSLTSANNSRLYTVHI